jgi:hypothetical protein
MIMRLGYALLLLSAIQGPPQPSRPSAMVVGQVIDVGTGRPVAGAIVTLGGPSVQGPQGVRVLTGSDGRFVFRDLRRGQHTITANKPGYADGAHGRNRAGGPSVPLTLNENERVGDIVIRVWKHAVISGTVVDESGERMVAVQLRAYRRSVVGGRRRYVASTLATTDDRGIYRISSLLPGDYIVATVFRQTSVPLSLYRNRPPGQPPGNPLLEMGVVAAADIPSFAVLPAGEAGLVLGRGMPMPPPSPDGRLFVYPTTFHPATTNGSAGAVITVRSGEEYPNADLQLTPVPTASVSGFVFGPDGPVRKASLRLVPANTTELASELDLPMTVTDSAGAFTLPAVPAGHYTIRLSLGTMPAGVFQSSGPVWLDAPLSVGIEDIDGLTLSAMPNLKVSGRLEFEGDTSRMRVPLSNIQVTLEPADLGGDASAPVFLARPSPSGDLSMSVPGGRYYVRVPNSPAGWMFKAATLDGRDVADIPFQLTQEPTHVVVTFTDKWSGVRGSVQAAAGQNATAVVIVFPTDRDTWGSSGLNPRRVRSVRPSKSGEYSLNLPPGDYYVIAIPEEQSAGWQDPEFLDAVSRAAARVTIAEGERKIQDLRTRDVR